ncbi:lysozyme [Paludibacterium purpuratum]|uniref:Lysozyme n=1 Tax=Paludibacterium purpuratum TaxID=1144873 RepID=A0A4R7BD68_9NEIS|nr:lysozyme [Paludibacterium purpuratum]TDR81895.1 GH24 family phage-related lysozyme (muramidase) [Paludibacterium purpuratum]
MDTQTQYGDGTGNPAHGPIKQPTPSKPIGGGTTNTTPGSVKKIVTDRLAITSLKLSEQGAAFIKGWEDKKSTPDGQKLFYYDDDSKFCTVGWGHLVAGKTSCAAQGIKGFPQGHNYQAGDEYRYQWITAEQAHEIFLQDVLHKAENLIKKDVKVPLYQHEFDALCDLAFNVGRLSVIAPKLLRLLNQGNYADAPEQMLDIDKSAGIYLDGLHKRRKTDYHVFVNNIYNSTH